MAEQDIRWQQRLSNYVRALAQLERAIAIAKERPLTELEQQGLVQAFEFTHELAWNLLKDYFEFQGTTGIKGSRDAFREAFNKGLIADGDGWMQTIRSRVQTVHTYNEETVNEIVKDIRERYITLFRDLMTTMSALQSDESERG